jgi:hypothetical protein
MALVKRRLSRKKMFTLIVFLAIIVLGGFWYLYQPGGGGIVGQEADPKIRQLQSDLSDLERVRQNLLPSLEKLYDDVRFQELKQYGDVPVERGEIGRPNPFQPL